MTNLKQHARITLDQQHQYAMQHPPHHTASNPYQPPLAGGGYSPPSYPYGAGGQPQPMPMALAPPAPASYYSYPPAAAPQPQPQPQPYGMPYAPPPQPQPQPQPMPMQMAGAGGGGGVGFLGALSELKGGPSPAELALKKQKQSEYARFLEDQKRANAEK